jgi:hypothetical protein
METDVENQSRLVTREANRFASIAQPGGAVPIGLRKPTTVMSNTSRMTRMTGKTAMTKINNVNIQPYLAKEKVTRDDVSSRHD